MSSLRELIAEAAEKLQRGPHPDRAARDAESLLLHLLGKDRAWLIAHGRNAAHAHVAPSYDKLIARRLSGEPMQYIRGSAEFYGLPFSVAPGVLIPRPETEHLVEAALELAKPLPNPKILDIGTGSGAIAITLAHHLPQATVTATDISETALTIARQNAASLGTNVTFAQADLLGDAAPESFDLIASNPPYIPETDRATLAVEVRDHEPESALFAGADGLDIYRRLIPAAHTALKPEGWLLLEIGIHQSAPLEQLLSASEFRNIRFVADYQQIPRTAIAQK